MTLLSAPRQRAATETRSTCSPAGPLQSGTHHSLRQGATCEAAVTREHTRTPSSGVSHSAAAASAKGGYAVAVVTETEWSVVRREVRARADLYCQYCPKANEYPWSTWIWRGVSTMSVRSASSSERSAAEGRSLCVAGSGALKLSSCASTRLGGRRRWSERLRTCVPSASSTVYPYRRTSRAGWVATIVPATQPPAQMRAAYPCCTCTRSPTSNSTSGGKPSKKASSDVSASTPCVASAASRAGGRCSGEGRSEKLTSWSSMGNVRRIGSSCGAVAHQLLASSSQHTYLVPDSASGAVGAPPSGPTFGFGLRWSVLPLTTISTPSGKRRTASSRSDDARRAAIAGPRRTSRMSVAGSDSTAQTAQRCMHARPIDGARTSS